MNPHASHPLLLALALVLAVFLFPSLAMAHDGHGAGMGFASGFAHPLSGIDHLLAMVAVGLWAAQREGRGRWILLATFVLVTAFGGLLGAMGVHVPLLEQGLIASVLVLGLLVAAALRLPLFASALIVGLFAVFHGNEHGVGISAGASGMAYGVGFLFATAFLHAVGFAAVAFARRLGQRSLVRVSGAAIAVCGVVLWLVA